MARTVQVLAVHCVLKRSSDIVARAPCSHLPSQQTGNSSSSTSSRLLQQRLLQHSVVHTTATPHKHTHTLMRMRMRTHIQKQTRARIHKGVHTHIHMRTHIDTRAHTYTRTNTRARIHARTHTRARIHARAHTHTRTHAYACTHCARDGLRQIFSVASNATTRVLNLCKLNIARYPNNYVLISSPAVVLNPTSIFPVCGMPPSKNHPPPSVVHC